MSVVLVLRCAQLALKKAVFMLDVVDLGPQFTDFILFLTLKLEKLDFEIF